MSTTSLSPNMNILVPVPSEQTGPQWATDLYNALYSTIDQHDHTTGRGAPITSASININSDFTLNGYNLTNALTLRLSPQSSAIAATSPNLTCLYAAPNGGSGVYDLWYNDGAGNQVPLTQNGSIIGTAGSISGLPSGTASASFNSPTFAFQSATNTAANIDGRSIILRNSSANSKSLTLSPPAAMSANIAQTLPAIPSQQNILTMDNTGAMAASWNVDGSTIIVSSNNITVNTGGITANELASNAVTTVKINDLAVTTGKINDLAVTTAKLADSSVTTAKINNNSVTIAKCTGAPNYVESAIINYTNNNTTYADVTNSSVNITTTGRLVMLVLQPQGNSDNTGELTGSNVQIRLVDGGTTIAAWEYNTSGIIPSSSICYIDSRTATGARAYKLQAKETSGATTYSILNARLTAYEMF